MLQYNSRRFIEFLFIITASRQEPKRGETSTKVNIPSLDPNNDILYQWRLKRRMEQAQEKVKVAERQAAFSMSNQHVNNSKV